MFSLSVILLFIARLFLGSYFVLGTIVDISLREEAINKLQGKNVPAAKLVFFAAVALKIIAGLAVIFNFVTAWAALALFIFTGIANVLFNNFWAEEGIKKQFSFTRFLVNLAVMGGLLLLVV